MLGVLRILRVSTQGSVKSHRLSQHVLSAEGVFGGQNTGMSHGPGWV